jgi:hypothetical protein
VVAYFFAPSDGRILQKVITFAAELFEPTQTGATPLAFHSVTHLTFSFEQIHAFSSL